MKAKTAVLVAGVGLMTGAMGIAVGSTVIAHEPVRASGDTRLVAQLEADLVQRDTEIAALKEELLERPAPAATDKSISTPVKGVEPSLMGLPKKAVLDVGAAREAAGRLGVTEHELEVAVHAYRALRTGSDPKVKQKAIDALRELGDRRAAAAAAVFRGISDGIPGGAEIQGMVTHSFAPEQAHHLIDVLKDDVTPAWTKGAIMRNLGEVDTPAVRDYIVERIAAEEDRYLFCDLATSVGKLKEERAVAHCVARLRADGHWIPFRPYILLALGSVGGPAAEAALLEHVRQPRGANLEYTLIALARIDPDLARREAATILAGARTLTEEQREVLTKHANR